MSTEKLTPLQLAFTALEETRGRLERLERAQREPIAIVGIGCRTPGDGDSPDGLWRVLRDGVDTIGPVPADRWNNEDFFDADPDAPGKTMSREAGFLRQVDRFDPVVFGISPREANGIDPQQRLFLELCWESLEDAGIAPDSLRGTRTGVYLGICTNDFFQIQLQSGDSTLLDSHFATGIAHSVAAGRVSYLLGLQGPSISIDTACSSALVAVHLACQSLRNGECRMALAGGVNAILAPEISIAYSRSRMLAPDGRCKAFDASADGFVRGEGGGVVALKRLSDAQADGDRIIAVIRGSAVNQDGPSSGLTAPNGPAQEAVIREALASAGLTPNDVGYIEAHGTGTELGDPLEMRALGGVFSPGRSPDAPLYVGSAKTNLGHLEAAAGIIGLIKVALSLQHRAIVPHLHFRNPSPHIPWDELPVVIPTAITPWPVVRGSRVGGVSSFGFSGTNAHAILEEAPASDRVAAKTERPLHVVTLSAQTEKALAASAARIADSLASEAGQDLPDVAYTLNAGRARLPVRAAFTAATTADARRHLEAIAAGAPAPGAIVGRISPAGRPRVAFLFTGQGAQHAGMGRTLYETSPVFRAALDECASILDALLPTPLLSVLYPAGGAASPIDQTGFAQPALFAIEYALATLWRRWGVEPVAVLGHSVGEVTAACVAGVLSLRDALRLIASRGTLMQALPAGGGMRAVFAPRETVDAFVANIGDVEIAAINGPEHFVLSGRTSALDRIGEALDEAKIKNRGLKVSHAFHSALMDPALDEFERSLSSIAFNAPVIRLVSNVTGDIAGGAQHRTAAYWRKHVRSPVRFAEGIGALAKLRCDAVLELGPSPVLTALGQECVDDDRIKWCGSLKRDHDDWAQLLESVKALHMLGVAIDWSAFDADYSRRRVALPTYPFQRERHWFAAKSRQEPRRGVTPGDMHPLLGRRLLSPLPQAQFEARITADNPAFIRDHGVTGSTLLPGTASYELALAAARAVFGPGPHACEEVVLREAMVFDEGITRVVQTIVDPVHEGSAAFRIQSMPDPGNAEWTLHYEGRLRQAGHIASSEPPEPLSTIETRLKASVDAEPIHEAIRAQGFEFGPRFRSLRTVRYGTNEALGDVVLPPEGAAEAAPFGIHPALLDCSMHVVGAALPPAADEADRDALYLPVGVRRVRILAAPGTRCRGHAIVEAGARQGVKAYRASVRLYGEDGTLVAEMEGLEFQRVALDVLERLAARRAAEWMYERQWEHQTIAGRASVSPGTLVILADRGGAASAVANALGARGHRYLVHEPAPEASGALQLVEYRALCRGWRQSFGPTFGVIDMRWLDARDWQAAGDAISESAVRGPAADSLALVQALLSECADDPPRLWFVTRGAQAAGSSNGPLAPLQSALWGMAWSIALEHPELKPVCVDLDSSADADEISSLVAELGEDGGEDQIALRGGRRLVARLARRKTQPPARTSLPSGESWRLVAAEKGTLDRLELVAADRPAPGEDEVELRVEATGLNFRDVLNVLGLYPGDPGPLGGECAGTVTRVGPGVRDLAEGDFVAALVRACFSGHVIARADLVQRAPAGYTRAEAAAVPIAYVTASYTLEHLAKLKAGDRVLIHAAAGGVGVAAVHLALKAGAEIFATAGSDVKRAWLRALGVHHVLDSRSTEFAAQILALTGGRGVDVVLNSLSGDFIDASFRAIAQGGRFVEIGKRGIWTEERVQQLERGIYYYIVDVGTKSDDDPALIHGVFARIVSDLRSGVLPPLPVTVFPLADAAGAFRHMMQARQIGKIVVSHVDAHNGPIARPDGTYVITGGLAGLGLAAAQWLADRGARHLALVSRRGTTPEAEPVIAALRESGVTITTAALDIGDVRAVHSFVEHLRASGPPIRGVLHAAGTIDDGAVLAQDWDRFDRVLRPKVAGAYALHRLTKADPLDWFVLFSSAASMFGSPGQANYSAANAVLDTIAHERRRVGRPAQSINWGPWRDIGMAAGHALQERLEAQGLTPLSTRDGLMALGEAMTSSAVQVGVVIANWARLVARRSPGVVPPYFSRVSGSSAPTLQAPAGASQPDAPSLHVLLESATPGRRLGIVKGFVRERTLHVLGQADARTLDDLTPLGELGLDSLLAVELRNALGRSLGTRLPATLLFDHPTIEALTGYLWTEILDGASTAEAPAAVAATPTGATMLAGIAELSDEEVERLLDANRPRKP